MRGVGMFYVYILENETTGKIYTGHSTDLERRLREHNDPSLGRRRYTRKQKGAWKLIYQEEFGSKSEAMRREKYLKSGAGREWIKGQHLCRQSPPEAD